LASQARVPRLQSLIMAPFHLHRRLLDLIEQVGQAAARGETARIVVKTNALTDQQLMDALVRAGRLGAQIDLIVRGACMLPARVPGVTDNIRVRSVVGRFLEHSRIFYFGIGAEETLLLSSADWMNRNMLRRVELAWPVTDPALRQRIVDECLVAYLHDERDAWDLMADGQYQRIASALDTTRPGVQAALMVRYDAGSSASGARG
jgi:polyphosphate kinase